MLSTVGTTIGPPADSEYPVEPVGVDTTSPSAEYDPMASSSTNTVNFTTRAKPPLCRTTSFSESQLHRSRPSRSSAQDSSAMRGSETKSPDAKRRTPVTNSSALHAVRNPRRPRLMPRMGTVRPLRKRAPRSSVPSPPSVNNASTCSGVSSRSPSFAISHRSCSNSNVSPSAGAMSSSVPRIVGSPTYPLWPITPTRINWRVLRSRATHARDPRYRPGQARVLRAASSVARSR